MPKSFKVGDILKLSPKGIEDWKIAYYSKSEKIFESRKYEVVKHEKLHNLEFQPYSKWKIKLIKIVPGDVISIGDLFAFNSYDDGYYELDGPRIPRGHPLTHMFKNT